MEQITKKAEEINELIKKHQKNININYQMVDYNHDKQLQSNIFLHRLNQIQPTKFTIKYGPKYKLLKKLNLILYLIFIATGTLVNIPILLTLFGATLLYMGTSSIINTLEPYYNVFRNTKITQNDFFRKLTNCMNNSEKLKLEKKQLIEEINKEHSQINDLELLKQQIENTNSNKNNNIKEIDNETKEELLTKDNIKVKKLTLN